MFIWSFPGLKDPTGCGQEAAVSHCLGLSAGQLDIHFDVALGFHQDERSKKEPGGGHNAFCDTVLKVIPSHFHHMLFMRQVTKSMPYTQGEKNQAPPSEGKRIQKCVNR